MGCGETGRDAHGHRPSLAVRAGATLALALLIGIAAPAAGLAATPQKTDRIAPDEASAFIDHLGRRVISLLADSKNVTKKQVQNFRKIFTEACDMDLIARQVLGRHWRTATEVQKKRYVPLFSEYVVQIYAAQFSSYSGESFDVLKEQASSAAERIVKTRIIRDNGEITYVDFRVRKEEERFRVVDVIIRGVSLLVAKRSEFDAIVRRQGLNGLLDQLEQRVSKSDAKIDPISRLAKETFETLETIVTLGR